jgi:hypothetical protein
MRIVRFALVARPYESLALPFTVRRIRRIAPASTFRRAWKEAGGD